MTSHLHVTNCPVLLIPFYVFRTSARETREVSQCFKKEHFVFISQENNCETYCYCILCSSYVQNFIRWCQSIGINILNGVNQKFEKCQGYREVTLSDKMMMGQLCVTLYTKIFNNKYNFFFNAFKLHLANETCCMPLITLCIAHSNC